MRIRTAVAAVILGLLVGVSASAEERAAQGAISVIGRASALVTTSSYRLSDIADVRGTSSNDDDAVIAIKKIQIDAAPRPGQISTVSADQVLRRLESAGVKLADIRYTLPSVVTVTRAARALSESEVRAAIEASMAQSGRDALVKFINMPQPIQVSTGDIKVTASDLGSKVPGKRMFALEISAEGSVEQKTSVEAAMDEWRELPVAKRKIARGAVVGEEDVMMARLNTSQLPQEVQSSEDKIIGLQASSSMSPGEAFSPNKLAVPPVIDAGSRVTLHYRSGPLDITASGVALEAGAAGKQIKVRNEDSRKVVLGLVKEAGIVEVRP